MKLTRREFLVGSGTFVGGVAASRCAGSAKRVSTDGGNMVECFVKRAAWGGYKGETLDHK